MKLFKKPNSKLEDHFDKNLMKNILDYNQDNLIDVKDIIDLSKDIENSFSKYSSLLKEQINEAKKTNS